MLRCLFIACACALVALPQDPPAQRCERGHADQGLPRADAVFAPYHADPDHRLNRVFRAIFVAEIAPAEVSAALPRESGREPGFFAVGWVHAKRPGAARDARRFGGDGRQLPREGFTKEESARLLEDLLQLGAPDRALLLSPPELAVLFQHDLLRIAERLLETGQNPELLPALTRAARLFALDAREREPLRDPLARALESEPVREELARRGALDLASISASDTSYREVLRRSTRLFDAEKCLLWSRVWLAHPEGTGALEALLQALDDPSTRCTVPIGFRAILLQGIVALGQDGAPYATPLVVDVRTQHLVNRDDLASTNATFTKDGIDFQLLELEREALRRGEPQGFFRFVDPDDQALFRDYGTLKHATNRAQCSLCHRNTGTPEKELGGFPVLRPSAKPRLATNGEERLRLAESEMLHFLSELPDVKGE